MIYNLKWALVNINIIFSCLVLHFHNFEIKILLWYIDNICINSHSFDYYIYFVFVPKIELLDQIV